MGGFDIVDDKGRGFRFHMRATYITVYCVERTNHNTTNCSMANQWLAPLFDYAGIRNMFYVAFGILSGEVVDL